MTGPTPPPADGATRPTGARRPDRRRRVRAGIATGLALAHVLLVAGAAGASEPLHVLLAGAAGASEPPPRWTWPLAGPHAVSAHFAPPATRYAAGHRGVDLPGPVSAPVLAAGAGRVAYAGLLAGRGVVVVVHGELRTTYEPVTALLPVGADVGAGEPIGLLEPGHDGCPVPACLHWGLRRGEDYLDPVSLVDRGPARLLPLGPARPPAGPPRPVSRPGALPIGTSVAPGRTEGPPAGDSQRGTPVPASPTTARDAAPVAAKDVPGARADALTGQPPEPAALAKRGERSPAPDGLAVPLALVGAAALATGFGLTRRPADQ